MPTPQVWQHWPHDAKSAPTASKESKSKQIRPSYRRKSLTSCPIRTNRLAPRILEHTSAGQTNMLVGSRSQTSTCQASQSAWFRTPRTPGRQTFDKKRKQQEKRWPLPQAMDEGCCMIVLERKACPPHLRLGRRVKVYQRFAHKHKQKAELICRTWTMCLLRATRALGAVSPLAPVTILAINLANGHRNMGTALVKITQAPFALLPQLWVLQGASSDVSPWHSALCTLWLFSKARISSQGYQEPSAPARTSNLTSMTSTRNMQLCTSLTTARHLATVTTDRAFRPRRPRA